MSASLVRRRLLTMAAAVLAVAGAGAPGPRTRIGTGWGIFDALVAPGDLNGDTLPDVVGRERGTGVVWLYSRDDTGRWRPRVRLGAGWQIFNVIT